MCHNLPSADQLTADPSGRHGQRTPHARVRAKAPVYMAPCLEPAGIESQCGMLGGMTTQIAVRLPEELVAYLDEQVAVGRVSSRAEVVALALRRERRRQLPERDAAIYAEDAADEDLASFTEHAAEQPMDIE